MAQKMMNSVTARRSFWLLGFFALASFLLAGVVFKMQVFEYDKYQEEVLNQITVENTVAAKRGTIYDRNMNIIATNQTTWRVFISPVDIQSAVYSSAIERAIHRVRYGDTAKEAAASDRQDELIASGLSEILGVEYDFVLKKAGMSGRRDETIKKNVDKETADRVLAFIEDNGLKNQVHLEATNKRYYPSGNMAAQTVGFTGADGQGLYGLEYYYNEELTGIAGRYIIAQDARGNEMAYNYESYVEPINGYHMVTTIDPQIQHELDVQVEAALHNSVAQNRACGIAMDPKTGKILAISVKPDFDLNAPYVLDELSQMALDDCGMEKDSEEYNKFLAELRQVMWSNKAITELYEPGSTFKIITSSMALEEKVVSPTETFTCTGVLEVGGFKIHCHKRTGHGTVTFARGLQQSCNPILMTIAARVGSEKFYSYFEAFGYLDKTGIDLPGEVRSVVGSQNTLYDPTKPVGESSQDTSRPIIVFNSIKSHLKKCGESRGMEYDDERLSSCAKRLMDMAVAYPESSWVENMRTILMEELNMPRSMVYSNSVITDTYNYINDIKWGGSQTILTAIGQSVTTVTPIAVARYVTAVANGGKVYNVSIVDSIISPEGEVLSRRDPVLINDLNDTNGYFNLIHKGMKGVTDDTGTAKRYWSDFKWQKKMGAKTGTAQVNQIDLENNGWFVCFAPLDNPKVAIVVYVPHGYSGAMCSYAAKDFLNWIFPEWDKSDVDYDLPIGNSLAP